MYCRQQIPKRSQSPKERSRDIGYVRLALAFNPHTALVLVEYICTSTLTLVPLSLFDHGLPRIVSVDVVTGGDGEAYVDSCIFCKIVKGGFRPFLGLQAGLGG